MDKKIVVLMATYNGERFLKEQLDSIFKQSRVNDLTLMVRDDGSIDQTISIIKEYASKYNIIILDDDEKHVGPAKSFWRLLNKAEGYDYYLFSDQDDIWDIDKIWEAVNVAEKYDVSFLYCSNNRKIDAKGVCVKKYSTNEEPKYDMKSVLVSSFAQGCSMLFNNQARQYAILQDEEYIPMHDLAVLSSTLIKGEVFYDLTPRFSHRVHSSNVDAINNSQSTIKKLIKAKAKWEKRSLETPLDVYASELLEKYNEDIEYDISKFLNILSNYKISMLAKIRLLFWLFFIDRNNSFRCKLNFAIRIFANWL